jgi:hypothetical protein
MIYKIINNIVESISSGKKSGGGKYHYRLVRSDKVRVMYYY